MGLRGWRTYHRTSAGSSLTNRGTDGAQRQRLPRTPHCQDADFAVELRVLEDAEAEATSPQIAALDEKRLFALHAKERSAAVLLLAQWSCG
jgi:hypothetical protein